MHASPHTIPSTLASLVLALTLSMSTSSCSTHRHATEVVTHTARDTLYINKLHYDSIFIALATQDIFLHEQILSHHLVVYHTIMQSFSNAKCRYESTHGSLRCARLVPEQLDAIAYRLSILQSEGKTSLGKLNLTHINYIIPPVYHQVNLRTPYGWSVLRGHIAP